MRRRLFGSFAVAAVVSALLMQRAVAAEVYALGTSAPGSVTYTMAAAIAAAGNKQGELLRVQSYGSSVQFVPQVESGEVAFAITNVLDLDAAMKGEGDFTGRPATHLRAVAFLFPFQIGFVVRADSGLERGADIKGKRVPNYSTQPMFQAMVRALLANAGVAESEIEYVPIGKYLEAYSALEDGRVDVPMSVPGQSILSEVEQRVGALRFLPLDDSPAAVEAMQRVLPLAYVTEVKPNPNFVGVDRPMKMLSYDYVLFANETVPDGVVAELVQRLHDNRDALIESTSKFKAFDPAAMAKPLPLPYHPGAEAYYRANGVWPTTP
jgi:hypothetical protein